MDEARAPRIEDETLVARAVAGDMVAFASLVERHTGRVHALAYRRLRDADVAEEAAQEAFLRAYVHLAEYRPGANFAAWLHAIAAHWCIDYRRKQRRRAWRTLPLGAAGELHHDTPATDDPEAAVLANEQRRAVAQWLANLPAPYRQVIDLRYFQGLSCAEIGNRLGQSITTVRVRLHRARRRLAQSSHPDHERPYARPLRVRD